MSKDLISKKLRNLLLNSETIKKGTFNKLYNYLQKNELITFDEIKEYQDLNDLTTYIDDLINACRSEWKPSDTQPVQDLGLSYKDQKIECNLCGYKYLKLKNKIVNQINGKVLVVGSECVKEFGEEVKGLIEKVNRDTRRAERRVLLENHIPGIRAFVETTNLVNSFDMIIPLNLSVKLSEITSDIKNNYEEFISEKFNHLDLIEAKWEIKEHIIEAIKSFVNENKQEKFAASFAIKNWILKNNSSTLTKQIREDNGFIKWRTIHKIYEERFMRSVLQQLNVYLKKENILIESLNPSNRIVKIRFSKKNKILHGNISYQDFLLNIGGLLYNETDINATFKDLIDMVKIPLSDSGNLIVNFVLGKLRNVNTNLVYRSGDELILKHKDEYIRISALKLINDVKSLYFEDNISNDYFVNWIATHKIKIMSLKEFKNYKQAKELASELKIKNL
ncbi:hypothetical protein CD30_15270 [Ureibacillus massiliensis 4400831 = CIP 108448 = CCUG 49529]|uniref:Uncharacterized protein n=1 Tax=Ureibacillus massiliensis 4400831 = CIP 108448 = CCUG 49529 TaxID=1211035 RepID=A0A0A3J3Q6_9BACL|nr:hypothetical protein [Ureibacillus massiliensis]KGR89783.1 hypothetical protein CD30_15270 [Ureibacillus massiliensis 4400831 = CIP 108448 = CCUG 49529]BDH63593.1 hypothetical protein MTP04_37230 [Lysinibacillus sp. PLM2]